MRKFTVHAVLLTLAVIMLTALTAFADRKQRRINPVNNAATRTQSRNDARADSARALELRRMRSTHYHDEQGNIIMVDTVTGVEWTDSTLLPKAPKMKYPRLFAINAGVDIWDPVMRVFGQHYGGAGAWVQLNMHNRYLPTFEFGMGSAKDTPDDNNYTYHGSLAPYFRIGMDYNFVYNSNPDYRFTAGVRYGFSAFKYSVSDIVLDDPYWGEQTRFEIPSTSVTAGWFEFSLGVTVRLFGPVSAGWQIKYHSIIHKSRPATGDAWYIPGYGTAGSSLGGSFSISYTIPLRRKEAVSTADIPLPEGQSNENNQNNNKPEDEKHVPVTVISPPSEP